MNQVGLEHPDAVQLTAFVSGRLGAAESEDIEAHLAECDVCCAVLEKLPADSLSNLWHPGSTVAEQIHAAPRKTPSPLIPAPGGPGAERAAAINSVAALAGLQVPRELADHPRYRVLGLLGVGGMGAVYKAEHRRMERLVALKVINPKLINSLDAVQRFRREVKAAARLAHPNIVTAYDADQIGAVHFLVMEFVEGKSLAQVVAERGPLAVAEACEYAWQAAVGLQHACDRGMVHRDIKPHNLMLTPEGEVKILDFGLARFVRESAHSEFHAEESLEPNSPNPSLSHLWDKSREGVSAETFTASGQVVGSADYIAPEQGHDAHHADIRSDIYSLGCTLYYLLAGHSPFGGDSLTEKLAAHEKQTPESLAAVRSDLSSELAAVIERMMAKDPGMRFQTPAEVAEALASFATAESPTRPRRWQLPTRRWAVLIASVLGLLLFALVVGLVAKLQSRREPDCIQAGSQWRGYFRFLPPIKGYYGDVRVSITERQGNTFKGTYATEDGRYEWEIKGTLDQSAVRWGFTRTIREKHPTHVEGSAFVEGHCEGTKMELRFRHPYDNSEADMVMVQVK
jgi:serine/threonine protein kinase